MIFIIIISISYFIFHTKTICDDVDGVTRNGILYLKGSIKPFTGKSLCIWDTANVTWYKGKYQDGLKEGIWIFYNKNSTKKSETNYSAGKMNGLRKVYNSQNQIAYTLNCIDNKCEHIKPDIDYK
jgi:hypothetical protein